jgi:hypothetical protein
MLPAVPTRIEAIGFEIFGQGHAEEGDTARETGVEAVGRGAVAGLPVCLALAEKADERIDGHAPGKMWLSGGGVLLRRLEVVVTYRRRSQAEAVQARPASAVADQVGLGGGAEFSSENLLELREVRREVAAVHAQTQRTLGFVEVLHRPGDPAQFDEVAQLPVGVGEFLGRCRQRRFAAQRTPGEDAEQGEFGRRQRECLAGGTHAARFEVDLQFGGRERVAGGFDGFVVARAPGEQRFGQAVAQADEGQFGERDLRAGAVDQAAAGHFEHAAARRRVVEAEAGLEGLRNQDVRELVLRAAVERQRVAEKETHRLAAAGDRDVQCAVRVGGELADQGGDAVGGAAVVFRRADVVERPAAGVFEDVDGGGGEIDRRQRVVPAEAVKPSRFFGEQGEAGLFGAAAGGDQVHLGGDERVRRRGNGEGVEGLGDDLRRQAGDGDENAARELVRLLAGVEHGGEGMTVGTAGIVAVFPRRGRTASLRCRGRRAYFPARSRPLGQVAPGS